MPQHVSGASSTEVGIKVQQLSTVSVCESPDSGTARSKYKSAKCQPASSSAMRAYSQVHWDPSTIIPEHRDLHGGCCNSNGVLMKLLWTLAVAAAAILILLLVSDGAPAAVHSSPDTAWLICLWCCAGEVDTLSLGDARDTVGRPCDNGQLAVIDPLCRCIGLQLYDGMFKVWCSGLSPRLAGGVKAPYALNSGIA